MKKKEVNEVVLDYKSLYEGMSKKLLAMSEKVVSLEKENKNLKMTIGGFQSSNARYKKENATLKAKLEDTEKSFRQFVKTNNEEQEAKKIRVQNLEKKLAEEKLRVTEVSREMTFYKENYEYFKKLPWYKRIIAR